MMYRALLTICFCFCLISLQAQQFGGFRPSTKWKQINTDTARIIYTPESAVTAQRVASLVHQMAANVNPLGNKLQKINMVLHAQTTLANGYVGLGPFRSEFYLVPGGNIFDFGNLPWAEQLAVHEYRHVQQYNNFNRGISKFFGILFGQEGRAVANAIAVPDWFWEGDAVYAETVLTPQGRGRMPYFLNGFNAIWKEGRHFNWMKLRNGSYKDIVPNHYPLGYLLVNYGYRNYGPDFWAKVTRDASSGAKFFPGAIRKHSGTRFRTFRKDALNYYAHEVSRHRDELLPRTPVVHEYYPKPAGADTIVLLKESFKTIPAFYRRTAAGDERIRLRSITAEDWLSYEKGTIAYTRYSTHPRWSLTNFSDIALIESATGKETVITRKQRYFTPTLSPYDSTLVAVYMNDSLQSELHFMDRTGNVLRTRKAPVGGLFVHPAYASPTALVVGIRQPNARMTLHLLDLQTMKFEMLLPPTYSTIGFFEVEDGFVYFSSSLNGQDHVYATRLSDRVTYPLTSGGSGHYFPAVADKRLYWSQYTSSGFRLRSAPIDSLQHAPLPPAGFMDIRPPFNVAGSDTATSILSMANRAFPVSDYKKGTGLLNFHSYRPYFEDPEFTFTLYGNNVLNTFTSQVYYRFNNAESAHSTGFDLAYGGWFPVLSVGGEHTFTRTLRTPTRTYTLRQTEWRAGYSIPLNFTRGRMYKYLDFGSDFVYSETSPTGASKNLLRSFSSQYLNHFLAWNHQLPKARQHIFPKFGYNAVGILRHRTDQYGYQASGSGNIYLPAIGRNQSIVFNGAFQLTDTGNVLFSNRFSNARGYPERYYSRMWKAGANYHFPLFYPDAGLFNAVYLLRVRANAFYDHSRMYFRDGKTSFDLRSAGGELYFDTKIANSLPLTFGVRYSYLLDAGRVGVSNPNRFEFVVPVNIVPR